MHFRFAVKKKVVAIPDIDFKLARIRLRKLA